MPAPEDNITAGLALSVSLLNTLYSLKLVTMEQAQDTIANALKATGPTQREAVREVYKGAIPAFVR